MTRFGVPSLQLAGKENRARFHPLKAALRQVITQHSQVIHVAVSQADEIDFWQTLPEKKFRDASDYKGGEKLKEFLDKSNSL
jgi:hypothetical protein